MTLAKLGQITKIESIDGGLADAVLDLQARIADELAPDFLLVDARTGITELGGLATTIVADRVVCLTSMASESIDGTLAVADALRTVPRLPGQKEIEIEFLLARIDAPRPPDAKLLSIEAEVEFLSSRINIKNDPDPQSKPKLDFSAVLLHDRTIANHERVLGGERTHDRRATLFKTSLVWIEKSFPDFAMEAALARKRMSAVDRVWHELTDDRQDIREMLGRYEPWPVNRLRTGVRFRASNNMSERFADIVAYDRPAEESGSKPLLVVEYVEGDDREQVAQWWLGAGDFRIVCLLGEESSEQRLFTRSAGCDSLRYSERRDLPMPHEFEALLDPGDISVETLIDAVRRGHIDYVPRLVMEWILASDGSRFHEITRGRHPEYARQILDGLASVDDIEVAKQILRRISPISHTLRMWMDSDDGVDAQVSRELFAPLCWRLPVEALIALAEASIATIKERGEDGLNPPPHDIALWALAEDFLGLRYDPVATSHRIGQPGISNTLPKIELTFAHSILESQGDDIVAVTQGLVQDRLVVTTGFLGNYEPEHARIVIFSEAIAAAAAQLAIPRRSLATITLLHEAIQAIIHVGRDLDGRMWPEFVRTFGRIGPVHSDTSRLLGRSPPAESNAFHTVIGQYFSYKFLLYLGDPGLLDAFGKLADYQPRPYQEWRRMKDIPVEDMRGRLMSIRRGGSWCIEIAPMT